MGHYCPSVISVVVIFCKRVINNYYHAHHPLQAAARMIMFQSKKRLQRNRNDARIVLAYSHRWNVKNRAISKAFRPFEVNFQLKCPRVKNTCARKPVDGRGVRGTIQLLGRIFGNRNFYVLFYILEYRITRKTLRTTR